MSEKDKATTSHFISDILTTFIGDFFLFEYFSVTNIIKRITRHKIAHTLCPDFWTNFKVIAEADVAP